MSTSTKQREDALEGPTYRLGVVVNADGEHLGHGLARDLVGDSQQVGKVADEDGDGVALMGELAGDREAEVGTATNDASKGGGASHEAYGHMKRGSCLALLEMGIDSSPLGSF